MIDIVIPLNNRSIWDNNELKFALRSVEKFLHNYRNVYIIGSNPKLNNVIHVQHPDQYQFPARNIYSKIMKACKIPDLSENFFFMNDDHFLLTDFDAANFPFFYKGYLKEDLRNTTNYRLTIENTIKVLEHSHPVKNFDTHTPILYNKSKFVSTLDIFDWKLPHAYAIKSLYCNMLNIPGVFEMDGKIRRIDTYERIEQFVEDKKVFSIDDTAITRDMKRFLNNKYPVKSKFEI